MTSFIYLGAVYKNFFQEFMNTKYRIEVEVEVEG